MADCILGIKCNGVSMKIDTLEIDGDQTAYDYICNVMLAVESNGNGRYDISSRRGQKNFWLADSRVDGLYDDSLKLNTLCLINTEILLMKSLHQGKKEALAAFLRAFLQNRFLHQHKKSFVIILLPLFVIALWH